MILASELRRNPFTLRNTWLAIMCWFPIPA